MNEMSKNESKKYRNCDCEAPPCYQCEYYETNHKRPPTLATDCIVVESLLCSKRVNQVAELAVPVASLGDVISVDPGGVINPPITVTPDINGLVSQTTVVKDMVITTGYLPVSISALGLDAPLQLNIPFQAETNCPGVCPEDTVRLSPNNIEASVTQGIEALDVSVANILFKVIISTHLTVTRPIIAKADHLKIVKDVNEDRCQSSDNNG